MKYVALLRGINVGGKNAVNMAVLKQVFEDLGFSDVKTYIKSGNVIFSSDAAASDMNEHIEQAIAAKFGFVVPVLTRDQQNIEEILNAVPSDWANSADWKVDVMFLWPDFDTADVLDSLTIKPDIDDVRYVPGAVVWRAAKTDVNRSGLLKIVGTDLYKNMTVRNINTVRKLALLMQ